MSKLSIPAVASLAIFAIFLEAPVAAQPDVLELLVVVDKPARERWMALAGSDSQFQEELTSTFLEVNEIFKSLADNEVNLEVRVKQFLVPDANIVTSLAQVDAATAMNKSISWIEKQKLDFDHAVVLVNADLMSSGYEISGYTMMDATCSSSSVSVLKAKYDYGTVHTLATLIAQSLSVDNDGEGKASACKSSDGYVMSSSSHLSQSENKWSFSSCSAEQIKTYIRYRGCLKMTTAPPLSGNRFGQVVGAEETCRRNTGKSVVPGYEAQICSYLHCLDKTIGTTTYMSLVESPEGLSCAPGKMCSRGACV